MDDLTQIRSMLENLTFNGFLIVAVFVLYRDSRNAQHQEHERTERTLSALTNQIFALTEKIGTLTDLLARTQAPGKMYDYDAIPTPQNGYKFPAD